MKGIIVDKYEGKSAVLAEDGSVHSIKDHGYGIGQEVEIKKAKMRFDTGFARWGTGIAAAIALFFLGGFAYATPTSYVSMDVNPSVEIAINMFDRVLDVKAVNDDGEEILSSIDLKNASIHDALEKLTSRLIKGNYISDDPDGGVIITTWGEDQEKAELLAAKLEDKLQEYIDKERKVAKVESEAVGLERVEEARELGVTPGKLNLVQKLVKSSPTPEAIIIDEWLDKPVKEINKLIKENRKALKAEEKNNRDKYQGYDALDDELDEDRNNDLDDDDKDDTNGKSKWNDMDKENAKDIKDWNNKDRDKDEDVEWNNGNDKSQTKEKDSKNKSNGKENDKGEKGDKDKD